MLRSHVSNGAKTAGQQVICNAEKGNCPNASEGEHLTFESEAEMAEFNELVLSERFGEISESKAIQLKDFRKTLEKRKNTVKVVNGKGVDEFGNQWNAKPYNDGFWSVEGVDAEGYHLANAMVPANSAEEAVNEIVENERYRRRNSANSEANNLSQEVTLQYERENFSDPKRKGSFLLINQDDGYILSDDCVVVDVTEDLENSEDIESNWENLNPVPIQDLEKVREMKNPIVIERNTGAITTLNNLYAVDCNDSDAPEDVYDDKVAADIFAEEMGFPLTD